MHPLTGEEQWSPQWFIRSLHEICGYARASRQYERYLIHVNIMDNRPYVSCARVTRRLVMAVAIGLMVVTGHTASAFQPTATLPDLLTFENGTRVATAGDWTARREELKALLQDNILGGLLFAPLPSPVRDAVLNVLTCVE